MKTMKMLLTISLFLVIQAGLLAQSSAKTGVQAVKTVSFQVYGNCDMCKSRIEASLKMDGVTKAEWDQKTKMASVTYDPSKVTIDAMQKKVASVGHDTEKYHAPDNVYSKLPDCCHYERAK